MALIKVAINFVYEYFCFVIYFSEIFFVKTFFPNFFSKFFFSVIGETVTTWRRCYLTNLRIRRGLSIKKFTKTEKASKVSF